MTQRRRRLAATCSGVSFFVFPLAHFPVDTGVDVCSTALLPVNSPSEISSCNTQDICYHNRSKHILKSFQNTTFYSTTHTHNTMYTVKTCLSVNLSMKLLYFIKNEPIHSSSQCLYIRDSSFRRTTTQPFYGLFPEFLGVMKLKTDITDSMVIV